MTTILGRVSIVGAGPGDPELITVRGLTRIRAADVLVYDRLVAPALLEEAPPTAERIFVGKARGHAALEQRAIEALLIDRSRAGKHVVRLKGGDPFVFGRGGEEVAALIAAGIAAEVVPGLTSATAVPASAGIPVTHRECSSSLTIVTGHEDPAKPESAIDWDWLAASPGTVVVLMGLGQIAAIRDRLIAGGRAADTPAAAIASGSLPEQRVVVSTLEGLPDAVAAAQLAAPVLVIIGDVVRYHALFAQSAVTGAPVRVTGDSRDSRREPESRLLPWRGPLPAHLTITGGSHD